MTVRFDLGAGDTTVTTAPQDSSGRYTNYSASIYLDYENWLTYGDANLDHEYGHAWSLYNAYMTQQDPSFAGYLKARGLTNDPRLDTSHAWNRREMRSVDTMHGQRWSDDRLGVPHRCAAEIRGADAFARRICCGTSAR